MYQNALPPASAPQRLASLQHQPHCFWRIRYCRSCMCAIALGAACSTPLCARVAAPRYRNLHLWTGRRRAPEVVGVTEPLWTRRHTWLEILLSLACVNIMDARLKGPPPKPVTYWVAYKCRPHHTPGTSPSIAGLSTSNVARVLGSENRLRITPATGPSECALIAMAGVLRVALPRPLNTCTRAHAGVRTSRREAGT